MGLFETVRVLDGRPQFLEQHLAQLSTDAEVFRLPKPPRLEGLTTLIPPGFTGVLRIYWAAGEGNPAESVSACELFVTLEARPRPAPNPHRLTVAEQPVLLAGAKTLNYWQNVRALRDARAKGFDEAVLWGWQGSLHQGSATPVVVSVAMANLFWVLDGRLQTPALATGARAGILRSWVIAKAGAEEVILLPEMLARAEFVFLTNSWLGVVPVVQLQEVRMPCHPDIERWNLALDSWE